MVPEGAGPGPFRLHGAAAEGSLAHVPKVARRALARPRPRQPSPPAPVPAASRRRTLDTLRALRRPKAAAMLALGFSSGLPFMLTGNTLGYWLREGHVSLTAIGFASWVGLAYTLKWVWAPLIDRIGAPLTGALLARPKGVRSVFNIRASYTDETENLIRHLATIGIKRVAVVRQNNAFGKDVGNAAKRFIVERKLVETATATIENDASDAGAAAAKIAVRACSGGGAAGSSDNTPACSTLGGNCCSCCGGDDDPRGGLRRRQQLLVFPRLGPRD